MYKVSQEVKNLFNKNYIQVADITVNGVNESFSVAENEIVQGSLSIDRYSVSNSKIEVGSAVAAELTLKLKNDDGKYDNTVFEGAEVFVKIGIKKWDAHRWENAVIHWIPCGYFTIDEPPRALSTITISALDRMILFDKTVDISKLSFPMTVADLLNKICTICGVTLATDITRLPNKDYQITAYPEGQDLTYRTLLQWCAALTGTCAFMNYDGNLELKWYEQTDLTISPSERYNSDMQENDVTITGIYFKDAANTEYIAGTDDYCLDLSSNGLLQDNVQVVLDTLYVSLKGFSYRPYTATIKSAPYKFFLLSRRELFMGDEVSSVKEGEPYPYYSNYSDYTSPNTGADSNRVKYKNGSPQWQWERTPNAGSSVSVRGVNYAGGLDYSNAGNSGGVAPACNVI